MGRVDECLVEKATRDARLVGRHDHRKPGAIEQPDSIDAVGKELHAVETIEIPHFFDQRPIAIQKDTTRHARTSPGVICPTPVTSPSRRTTAETTTSTVTPFMHRWSIGQSRSMQGRQKTGCNNTSGLTTIP